MKKFYNFLLILIANFILISSAQSATFYVNAVTGSNGNSPSQAKNIETPWQSVQYAIDNASVVDGDNIVVAAGTYSGFNLTKRINIIGAWKGSNPALNTVFNTTVTLNATGGSSTQRMVLKNLRVAVTTGDAIDMRQSYVTLENVSASATTSAGVNGLRVNKENLSDLLIEACNFNNSNYSGIYFPTFAGLDGFVMKNTTVNDNGYFGIAAFQRRVDPTMIENVLISHCAFVNNNPTNQIQGHTIYFEKLRNSVFENISVVMPTGNIRIGIDINLLARLDYSNIEILNSRVFRATPGSGIWVQARNDLFDPPAALENVTLRGLTFDNCDTLIAFNRQISTMKVDKCDLSNYLVYGLVNYTDQGGTIDASNNKWKNGTTPDTTVISGGLLTTGNNIISFMPSTNGIFVGMGIVGPGIPPNTYVTNKSPNTITMSNPALVDGFIPQIGFAFNFNTSTNLVRTSLNFIIYNNTLPNSIINQANVSFPNLASAISGTSAGGTIYNVPDSTIAGTTTINKNLTLISPGAGFLYKEHQTTFDNLEVTGAGAQFNMGSDFAVANNLLANGLTKIGQNNTLSINGAISSVLDGVPVALEGGNSSDMFIGGTSAALVIPHIENGLRTLQINRPNGASLGDNLNLSRLLFLQNGIITLNNFNLSLGNDASIFNPSPATSFIETNSTGSLRKFYSSTSITAFNYTIGRVTYSPVQVYFSQWTLAPGAYLDANTKNLVHPFNNCTTDYLKRYWTFNLSGITSYSANNTFTYDNGDVVGTEANIYGAEWNGISWTTFSPVNTAGNFFKVNNITAFKEYSGGGQFCIGDFGTTINVKVYLEGPYIGGGLMRTDLNSDGLIPLAQPFNDPQYNYNGTESVGSIPAGVVDWVYLEIRSTDNGVAIPGGRRAAFVKDNGSVVDLDGINPVKITGILPGNYYVVVGHRNHLPIMSANAIPLNTSSILFDFSANASNVYGGEEADLGSGVLGMYSGDANKSFLISAADYTIVTNNLLSTNYNNGDLNLSGVVTAADYPYITRNLLKSSNVPNF
ncbi:MAG: hypothetical protein JST15_05200 [Bacteroidetes bacterium]|nr:hypothetical protein [Bacteroidota bacterium]